MHYALKTFRTYYYFNHIKKKKRNKKACSGYPCSGFSGFSDLTSDDILSSDVRCPPFSRLNGSKPRRLGLDSDKPSLNS